LSLKTGGNGFNHRQYTNGRTGERREEAGKPLSGRKTGAVSRAGIDAKTSILQILVTIHPVGLKRFGLFCGSRFCEIAHRLGRSVLGAVRRRQILGFGTGSTLARAPQIHDLAHS
jgi:hypothetical protein